MTEANSRNGSKFWAVKLSSERWLLVLVRRLVAWPITWIWTRTSTSATTLLLVPRWLTAGWFPTICPAWELFAGLRTKSIFEIQGMKMTQEESFSSHRFPFRQTLRALCVKYGHDHDGLVCVDVVHHGAERLLAAVLG